jgi:hypothetical protein
MSETPKRTELTTRSDDQLSRGELQTATNRAPVSKPTSYAPPVQLPRGGSLLEHAFNTLPADKQQELMQTALEEKIKLEVQSAKADQAHENFETETNQSVRHIKELGKTGMDITANYEGKMASGSWQFEARKSNYTLYIAVAAIIGIVLLVVALRG